MNLNAAASPRDTIELSKAMIHEPREAVRPPSFLQIHGSMPHEVNADGTATWYLRAQHMVVVYSEVPVGATIGEVGQEDECTLVLPDASASVRLKTSDGEREVGGRSVVMIPPGDHTLRALTPVRVVRLFTVRGAGELAAKAFNAALYSAASDNFIRPFQPYPTPAGGFQTRVYRLDQNPPNPDHFSWVFRCTSFLVNWVYPLRGNEVIQGPDKTMKIATHWHRDFDQVIFMLNGEFDVYARVPWTFDRNDWHPDQYWHATAPAALIIPPRVVHCAFGHGDSITNTMDLFCPTRHDYARMPECRNGADYPLDQS